MDNSMKYLPKILLGCLVTLSAQAEGPVKWGGNVALTSDYVFRGFTQTDSGPAIQGEFDINHETGAFLKVWASNVKFLEGESVLPEDRASIEIDTYLGYDRSLSDNSSYGLQVARFMYPDAGSDLNYDMTEFNIHFSYTPLPQTKLAFAYDYSPEFAGKTGNGHHYNLSFNQSLADNFGVGGYVGRQAIEDNEKYGYDDYLYYGVSLSYSPGGIDTSLTYSDTDLDTDKADGRVVFTISKTF